MYRDIFPITPIAHLKRGKTSKDIKYDLQLVGALTGMSPSYIKKALGNKSSKIPLDDIYLLLELDAFSETFIPRSKIPDFLRELDDQVSSEDLEVWWSDSATKLLHGSATNLIPKLPAKSIQCIVTSTPYWGTRIYEESIDVKWSDGETCPFGHEQTPEGFVRHSVEMLFLLKRLLKESGSIWWNVMDTYNTRTQIRASAAETMKAMQGKDSRGWKDHLARRYSGGHSFLKDGEQSLVPERIAERASRIGYWVKSSITWKKNGSMPETVSSRVTREKEHIIHLSLHRTPLFQKEQYLKLPQKLGGKGDKEAEKLTDVWMLPTSSGRDGHGAQFPLSLPGRCIALTTQKGDLVLDPFIGAGTTAIAANQLGRRCIGIDVSDLYLKTTKRRLETIKKQGS